MSRKNEPAFLLIHGFASTNNSMESLAEFLRQRGFYVENIDLPGHNTKPEDLLEIGWEDWTNYTQKRLDDIKVKYNKVFVIGSSLGGLITLFLGIENPDLQGIVALATPYKAFTKGVKLLEIFPIVAKVIKWYKMPFAKMEDPKAHQRIKHYNKFPTQSMVEATRVMRKVRGQLHQLRIPILLVYAKKDPIVNPKQTNDIFLMIKSKDKQRVEIEKGYHSILVDAGRKQAIDNIWSWLKRRGIREVKNL